MPEDLREEVTQPISGRASVGSRVAWPCVLCSCHAWKTGQVLRAGIRSTWSVACVCSFMSQHGRNPSRLEHCLQLGNNESRYEICECHESLAHSQRMSQ